MKRENLPFFHFAPHIDRMDSKKDQWVAYLKNGWKLRFKSETLKESLDDLRAYQK